MNKFRKEMNLQLLKTVAGRSESKEPRELTPTVCSRWYRAPEAILLCSYYNQSLDIWSIGCVLNEILQSSTAYLERKFYRHIQRVAFPGGSCHPLSPLKIDGKLQETESYGKKFLINENDQLVKICNRKMDSIDTSFLTNKETVEYTETLKTITQKKQVESSTLNFITKTQTKQVESFTELLPDSHDGLVEILESMTEFNPYFRPSAKDLLKNKIFDDIRLKSFEEEAPYRIMIDIDQNELLKPNYEDDEQNLYSAEELKQRIQKIQVFVVKEISKLQKYQHIDIKILYK